ncbi:methylated-DNA--[protein]-cysteine S-methyltransferase [Alkalihalobacterium chitinilyticum]|uniref:Methylated-DNA--protein-cysteine methyltransferase n=1 Tax=Alkalihalobacterium chitinilyticum TaxID=2980103 RepID=A0ABT5VL19_9BACI|nr:methylated-DNA--[protein]-cysteine S-methyltransferase [Alkalihalobacterium chitinilyticum]MDE5415452.1 methylated-DNA--[protein]-cysteine S-methyltransferase [Alkalihalobacterium chitinilyticum]
MSAQSTVYYDEMDSPIGALTISATERGVCHIHFGTADFSLPTLKAWLKKQGIKGELVQNKEKISPIVEQLSEYFVGERHEFELPIDLYGTGFQKKVWEALRNIGYGETRSYKKIAQEIGAPKAVRAIGGANNQNPIPIIIPCHRVIGSNGAMVGYGGGLDKKEILLQMEGAIEKIS